MSLSIPPKWGIRVFAVWALILTVLALAQLLMLTVSVELYSNQHNNQSQVWVVFVLNVTFALGFAASAYGLWQQLGWGRKTFLWIIVMWSGFNFISLFFMPSSTLSSVDQPFSWLLFGGLRYVLGLMIPVLYLNLPHIKASFVDTQQNKPIKDNNL